MNLSVEETAKEVRKRILIIERKKKAKKMSAIYGSASAFVFSLMVVVMQRLGVFGAEEGEESVYGSFLLSKEAGGYVLVGVICFVLAVIITLICVNRRKTRSEDLERNKEDH